MRGLIDRKGKAGGKADLRHLVDIDAVLRQLGADGVEEGELRRELVPGARASWPGAPASRRGARRGAHCIFRVRRSAAAGSARRRRSARLSACARARALRGRHRRARSASSLSTPQCVIGLSSRVPTPSTASASPHNSRPSGSVDAERVAAVEHAAAAPVGQHRRLQHVGEQRHFGRGVLRAAAGDDEHALGFAEELGGLAHGVLVDAAARAPAAAARAQRGRACPRRRWRIRARPGRGGLAAWTRSPWRLWPALPPAHRCARNDRPAGR